jgi:carbon-monoxide dehydrogenase large subunit
MLDSTAPIKASHETRIEDDTLVRGEGHYAADVPQPNQAYGAFVRSQHACAKITSIDTEAARGAPGVLAVLTGAVVEAAGIGSITRHPPVAGRGGTKLFTPPRPVLAKDRVVHIGQTVALVVAETALAAQDAAELIAVEYEPTEPVIDLRTAGEPGATRVWPEVANNVALDWTGPETNTEDNVREVAGIIAGAVHVVRMSLVNQRIAGVTMEPRGATASYDAATESYTVRVGTQGAAPMRDNLAAVMGTQKVRVLTEDVGGGFGLKTQAYPEYPALMLAAKTIGRPVHWMATRSESFTSDNEARDAIADCELALNGKGRFLALRMRVISNLGAFLAPPGALIQTASLSRCLPGMYDIPKVDIQARCMHTNTIAVGAYRGAGRPEANYILERLVDEAARLTGIDRVSLRRRNLIRQSAIPYRSAVGNTYDSGDFAAILDKALELGGYATFKQRRRESAKRGKLRGLGVSCFLEHAGATPLETASLVFPNDGTMIVGIGVQSNGQGHATVFTRLVMDRLGLTRDIVKFKQGDSDLALAGAAAVGSRSAMTVGHALMRSIDVMLEKGRKVAANMLETSESDIEFDDGRFQIVGTDRRVSLIDVAKRAVEMKARGEIRESLDTKEKAETPLTFPNGCHLAEVEIDPETGHVDVVSYSGVDDSGNVLNHVIVEGQLHGGVVQGIGQVLMEHTVYEPGGQIVTASFMDYAMPHAHDLPPINCIDHPVPATTNPLGVKGVGEAGTTGALAAVMNAIIDAIPNGAGAHLDMPATAEKVWQACRQNS